MNVYIVGVRDAGRSKIICICTTYEVALKQWNIARANLLARYKEMIDRNCSEDIKEIFTEAINNLSCEVPDKIEQELYETPYIQEYKLVGE